MITIKQVAEECGVSKSTAHRILKSIDSDYVAQHSSREGGKNTLVLDGELASLIASKLKTTPASSPVIAHKPPDTEQFGAIAKLYEARISDLQATIAMLENSLKSKDELIEELSHSLVEATKKRGFWSQVQKLLPKPKEK